MVKPYYICIIIPALREFKLNKREGISLTEIPLSFTHTTNSCAHSLSLSYIHTLAQLVSRSLPSGEREEDGNKAIEGK